MLRLTLLFLLFFCGLIFSRDAFAYLDPGSGSYIIQILIGTLLGGFFAIKVYWRRLKSYFSKDGKDEEANKH